MKRIALLGSTGSIGTHTLDVIASLPGRFEVLSLSARRNIDLLCQQAERFRPRRVSVSEKADAVRTRLKPLGIEVLNGEGVLEEMAADGEADLVVNGLAAGMGLRPTISAVCAGNDVAIANKETLVVAGHLVTAMARENGVRLVPIDSEMTPLWQTLQDVDLSHIRRVVLPASGGPFFEHTKAEMARVTREEALNHPTWKMGEKITIDSATLMNKGFEVIEAQWFLNLPVKQVDVIIHRQSIVHCLIEYIDGGFTAHLSTPDMRLPIHQALMHPEKERTGVSPLRLSEAGTLSFHPPDLDRFPCLGLAYEAAQAGGTLPAVLSAANEIAVYAFMDERIGFMDIPRVVRRVLDAHTVEPGDELEAIFEADGWGRREGEKVVGSLVN